MGLLLFEALHQPVFLACVFRHEAWHLFHLRGRVLAVEVLEASSVGEAPTTVRYGLRRLAWEAVKNVVVHAG